MGSAVAAGVGFSALTGAATGAAGVSTAVCVTGVEVGRGTGAGAAGAGVGAGVGAGAGVGVEVKSVEAGLDDDAPALG